MVNRYPGECHYCHGHVDKNAGECWRPTGYRQYLVAHLECHDSEAPRVATFNIGGQEFIRNTAGRCEDAPCCGCCTI